MGQFEQTFTINTTLLTLTIEKENTKTLIVEIVDITRKISNIQRFTLGEKQWLNAYGAPAFDASIPVSGESAQKDIDVATEEGYFKIS